MKQWMILGLAAVGAYALWQWYQASNASAKGQGAHDEGGGQVVAANSGVDSMAPGIPVFNETMIANGHGDQVAASRTSNSMATLPGGGRYQPAFGPDENRGGMSIW